MKKYGIYLAYSPSTDLRKDGLGRYLTEFLTSARHMPDVRFVVGCPSWTRGNLMELFAEIGAGTENFEVISPDKIPILLRLQRYYENYKKRIKRKSWLDRLLLRLEGTFSAVLIRMEKTLVSIRSTALMAVLGIIALPFVFLVVLWQVLSFLLYFLIHQARPLKKRSKFLKGYFSQAQRMASRPSQNSAATHLFRLMEEVETQQLSQMINARGDIAAWYCPTAFWPSFNQITAPRLMCVPDVVVGDFPAGFSQVHGNKLLAHFERVEKSVLGGTHFVTYSEEVKQKTLVARYYIPSSSVTVVRHGAIRLDELVTVSGFANDKETTDNYCRDLLKQAFTRAVDNPWAPLFGKGRVKFLFYASQFRPNKNVLSLLKAYEFLLRRRYIGHKLILTGNPKDYSAVRKFVTEHRLENDVLCLKGLSLRELAACYRLADLAVNPSLSEGGCPFTLTEALSVGTPVVMARIPVTQEVITERELQNKMLFDPYDWKDMAEKIEWGVQNRAALLELQKPFYQRLSQRDWGHVVEEYVGILDRISTSCPDEVIHGRS